MISKLFKYLILLFIPIFYNCTTIETINENKPLVLKVDTTLIESSKRIQENCATSIIEFQLFFDSIENISNIKSIKIESPEGSKWTFGQEYIIDRLDSENGSIVFDTLTSSEHKHYIPLGDYEITINYNSYKPFNYIFNVYGRGNPGLNSGRIYTEATTEELQILTTPVDYRAEIIGDNLVLNFISTDGIITDGYIWVYNEDSDCISVRGWFSDTKPVISVGENEYSFDVKDKKNDIKSIELVLYSDTTSLNDETICWCRTGSFPVVLDFESPADELQEVQSTDVLTDSDLFKEDINWNKIIGTGNLLTNITNVAVDKHNYVYIAGYIENLGDGFSNRRWILKKYNKNGIEDLKWNKSSNRGDGYSSISSICFDADQNVYISGYKENLISSNSGYDLWIKKFNNDGVEDLIDWNKKISLKNIFSPPPISKGMIIDSKNNVYITAVTNSNFDIKESDWVIMKFDSSGHEDKNNWNKIIGKGKGYDWPLSLAIDEYDNIYASGIGDNIIHDKPVKHDGMDYDWWIKKFSPEGIEDIQNWDKKYDGNGFWDWPYSIVTDNSGYLYVCGYGGDLISENSDYDWWIKKFDLNGNEVVSNWNKIIGDKSGQDCINASVITNHNNLIVGGFCSNSGSEYFRVTRFSSNGEEQSDLINFNDNIMKNHILSDLYIDNSGDLYITGSINTYINDIFSMKGFVKKLNMNMNID